MPEAGLEPTHLAILDLKSRASTNSAIRAIRLQTNLEAWTGIEPAHGSFANFSVTISPPRLYYKSFEITSSLCRAFSPLSNAKSIKGILDSLECFFKYIFASLL